MIEILRHAQDEVERKVAAELRRNNTAQENREKQCSLLQAKNLELQKDLDKMTTQKNYVSDAFEASRKETAKLRTENKLANEELQRLRRTVEELTAERVAANIGRKAMDAEISALELEVDVRSRALGTATKQLFGTLGKQQEGGAAASKKAGPPSRKAARPPTGKASGSPRASSPSGSVRPVSAGGTPTGGQRTAPVGAGAGGGRGGFR